MGKLRLWVICKRCTDRETYRKADYLVKEDEPGRY